MADPRDAVTQFDVQGLPQEEAAKVARARAAALAQQQYIAGMLMQNERPEMQKLGETDYANAGREREGLQGTATNVFKQALGEKEAGARMKELELQGKHMMGMLGIAVGHLGLEKEQEGFRQQLERYRAEIAAERPPQGKAEEDLVQGQVRIDMAKKLGAPKALIKLLESNHEAHIKALESMGYRVKGSPPKIGGPRPAVTPAIPAAAPAAPAAAPAAADPWSAMRGKYGGGG